MIEDNFPTPGEISHLLFFSSFFFFWKIAVHYVKTPSLLKKSYFFSLTTKIEYSISTDRTTSFTRLPE